MITCSIQLGDGAVEGFQRSSAGQRPRTSVSTLLDLTAAFDTVDHELLLRRLQRTFGIGGSALSWFESYLSGRTYCVVVDSATSQVIHVLCSVPQGSVLGPMLFLLYTAEIAELAARFGVTLHAFADDNQLYLSCTRKLCYSKDDRAMRAI